MTAFTKAKNKKHPLKLNRQSLIVAQVIISESELSKVIPDYSRKLEEEKPDWFRELLYNLGIDTSKAYIRQDGLLHRNRFGEVVLCSRWVGEERLDKEWLYSGHASQAAKDKATNSRLLESMYRQRGLTEDVQRILEEMDSKVQVC
jgi:hypothetical protein